MRNILRVGGVAAASTMLCVTAFGGPAEAQVEQDGLVNVNVGDVTILEDVRVAVAANVVAQICGLKVGPVAVLGQAVDATGTTNTVCTADTAPITIDQNTA
jgi:hypothetical protein